MTIDEASQTFQSVIPIFREAWTLGWADMQSQYNNPDWSPRVRSNVLQAQAVLHAKRLTADIPEIIYRDFEGRDLFKYNGCAFIQLKQLDQQLRSKNYQTRTATAFAAQMEIDGLQTIPRFTIGLVPDAHWIAVAGIYLTYPRSTSGNNWELDITGDPVDVNANQATFDEPSFKPASRWKIKRSASEGISNGV